MPRNASGTYTLPAGNPVTAGTLIDATWANSTLNDLANEITDSLSRSGEGGMLAPFRLTDGLQATPSLAFSNEPSSGLYRAGTNEWWAVVGGTQVAQYTINGLSGRFAAGAVGTPSITRLGDLDTGMYFPGANELALSTGGTLRLSIDAAGAVTIPGALAATGGMTGAITSSNATITGGTINGSAIGGSTPAAGAFTTLSATSNLTVDTDTLFVNATSNRVGVGTTTPAVKLDVAGGISIANSDNLTWGGAYGSTTPAISGSAGFLAFYPNGSTSGEQMRLNATGLGIGTSAPTFGSGTGLEIERAGIATLRLENSSASNSFELYADTAANGINLRGRDSSPLIFWTSNTERARMDASGNFLVGLTSQLFPTTNRATIEINGSAQSLFGMGVGGTSAAYILHDGTNMDVWQSRNGYMRFATNNAERIRITSSGGFNVATTSEWSGNSSRMSLSYAGGSNQYGVTLRTGDSGTSTAVNFLNGGTDNGGGTPTVVGTITATTTATAYNTSSDRRLKDNIAPADDAGAVIDSIAIVKHDWKRGGHVRYGVIAQDLNVVAPEAVTAGDDQVDIEKPWGVDYSKLVPMLIKEIQSLRARVAVLEGN